MNGNTVPTTAEIVDGRVAVSADVDASLYLDSPEHRPLTKGERHATLRLAGDGVQVAVELDAEALDALADAIFHAQEDER